MTKIYVGNLPFSTTEDELRGMFASHGTVESVALPIDRDTGRPRGFGFVQMESTGATAAITALNGHSVGGRALRVNEAEDRAKQGQRGGGGGGFRSGSRY
jgi:RNA recognition motif-containing protein